ncbi:ATP synthase F1 subcomplex gamma subunit [Thermosyntropha lipolytica DSM 11003]|uniref:ATP synthase gamma chain n=1 Tax=Thermosyntropha lipolytica DSM 11003 TaxID=1123382 RepID=A0A1M5NTS7_9FIRM|nr:ATP synthase F1 subunit gamma [Thermosyntropha lipolytica]SHG92961.1 ATP synthase F1 subcomplex gamma subunit [Thermosyntropha lipolytica DSM 11003]
MAKAGVREYKRRIRSVKNTQQITKAMKMVAAAKLRRAQEKAEASRPYTETLRDTLARLVAVTADINHPLLTKREEVKKVGYVVVAADRGLCGAYNTNIIKAANAAMAEDERDVEAKIIAVGRKVRDFYRKRGGLIAEYVNLGDNINYADAREIAQYVMKAYEDGELDEVYVVYGHFVNALRQVPTVEKILPIEPPAAEGETEEAFVDYIYEPDAVSIIYNILPRYVGTQIYHAMLESKASEHGARMTAMSNATDNAAEIIENLTLEMNKARQAAITKEILDIVGGAEALKKGGK